MELGFRRIISVFLTFVFILSAFISGTYGWQNLQTATNETASTVTQVRLKKLEKLLDGTETNIPVPGAAFYLFSADGRQIGTSMTTDDAGTITIQLPAGEYYFEEFSLPPSFTFDRQDNEQITKYPFEVPENGEETVTVTAYNIRLSGSLSIRKTVKSADASPLGEEHLTKDFTFTVLFSDGGAYAYRKSDGTAGKLTSGGIITLCHGETVLFDNLPAGIVYTVTEQAEAGYITTSAGHCGTICTELSEAVFINTYTPEQPPENPVKLTVTKRLAGEYPEADLTKEFEMTFSRNGVLTNFTLTPGEIKEFVLTPGDVYEICEKDYSDNGYSQTITGGFGTAGNQNIETTVTNFFTGAVIRQISGKKIWQGENLDQAVLPESITVFLKNGDYVVQKATVKPNENGDWLYSFTAPKYDAGGNEIIYSVEEAELESFRPTYNGLDIVNIYIPPVTVAFPSIFKSIDGEGAPDQHFTFCIAAKDGAPMPENAKNSLLTLTLTGSGEIEPGEIRYTKAGIYVYTVTETGNCPQGWFYDKTVYTVTVTVTEKNGTLTADTLITKDDSIANQIEFVNSYENEIPPQDITIVEGQKIWIHGDNPEEDRPDSIVVLIYGDGEIVLQQQITEEDGWHYRFELPKYNALDKEIFYTVDEAAVENYHKAIDGYNLINTYRQNTTPKPNDPGSSPPTEDDDNLYLWILLLILSGSMAIVLSRKNYMNQHKR